MEHITEAPQREWQWMWLLVGEFYCPSTGCLLRGINYGAGWRLVRDSEPVYGPGRRVVHRAYVSPPLCRVTPHVAPDAAEG